MVVVAVFALSRSTCTTGLGTANAAEMFALANPKFISKIMIKQPFMKRLLMTL
jgi:hypothetical protein